MIGRAFVIGGAAASYITEGITGLVLFAVLFPAMMLAAGAADRRWFR